MFVELGSTPDVWRAHIVRGILACHGIDAVVWHENAVHLYGAGWGAHCLVLVNEDDMEGAIETLRAQSEPLPEPVDAPSADSTPEIFPGFWALFQTGAAMWIALFLYEMAMNFLIRFVDIESRRIELDLGRVLLFMLIGAPTIGAVWAVVTFVVMYPLRAIRGDGWMALLAYLWVWAIFCLLTFGLAFSASR